MDPMLNFKNMTIFKLQSTITDSFLVSNGKVTFEDHNKVKLTRCYSANFCVTAVCPLRATAIENNVVTDEAEIRQRNLLLYLQVPHSSLFSNSFNSSQNRLLYHLTLPCRHANVENYPAGYQMFPWCQ